MSVPGSLRGHGARRPWRTRHPSAPPWREKPSPADDSAITVLTSQS